MTFEQLKRLVQQGEGQHLEFKRKANHPDKIAREIIAFANSTGGTLLIGIMDNLDIIGCKNPDEEAFAVESYLQAHVYPEIPFSVERIDAPYHRQVLKYYIPESAARPHFLRESPESVKKSFVRVEDMSIRASREMVQLLKFHASKPDTILSIGPHEQAILAYLETNPQLTIEHAQALVKLRKRIVSGILVKLVRFGLLEIYPSIKGDYFKLRESAFK
ncbi:ATP-binding protein [Pontibacter sp. G13]|uniref:AlbA family DNA-binding domain-containing protein n=1 Tax=Pontibacter sp. G13 TaxID=3074898 RepID=UPI00288AB210|nr:ATP-binding protein [Pontibacter sp. G13]WNJ20623.1 ATP-binding protein [Pontibacter sp. G13]